MDRNGLISYIEPIFRFCCKRVANRHDAEDLASEILCHVLDGMGKYEIESLDAWVWRVAHNRYARFAEAKNRSKTVLTDDPAAFEVEGDYCEIDGQSTEEAFEPVFRYLHSLSAEYRNIFVDYYVGELGVRELSKKYSLPETTVKWRLNVGRQKIKNRIGEESMDKIYSRINWNTDACNGSLDTKKYLNSQIARAICAAVYEKPKTVEEISLATGLPTMYIEDELPRLEYGNAICRQGNKYAADFIIFSLADRAKTEIGSVTLVEKLSARMQVLLESKKANVAELGFYGSGFGLGRLGYVIVPYVLRKRISEIMSGPLGLKCGPYPPRSDGGYGWFIVEETENEEELIPEYATGCNSYSDSFENRMHYYWVGKYFSRDLYFCMCRMCENGVLAQSCGGFIPENAISPESAATLIQHSLLAKAENGYMLNFPVFEKAEFEKLMTAFSLDEGEIDSLLAELIISVRRSFAKFVPARLEGQINQWVTIYVHRIVGHVIDGLIRNGALVKPAADGCLANSVFCVHGEEIEP